MDYTNPKEHFCSNENCSDYNKTGADNIIRRGHNAKGQQMFMCKTCGVRFVETKGTVFYNRHLSEKEIVLICKLLMEKNSIRAIERITEHHRDTIGSLVSDLATHCREVTDFLIKDVGLTKVEVDEMWSFIKKSKRTLAKESLTDLKMAMSGYT
jgi:transposase-like protein